MRCGVRVTNHVLFPVLRGFQDLELSEVKLGVLANQNNFFTLGMGGMEESKVTLRIWANMGDGLVIEHK